MNSSADSDSYGFPILKPIHDPDLIALTEDCSSMYFSARVYLLQQFWLRSIHNSWIGLCSPSLVGVYLFHVLPWKEKVPLFHWLVSGPIWQIDLPFPDEVDNYIVREEYRGLPAAYIWTGYPDFEDPLAARTPARALESYCGVMEDWIKAVRKGKYRKVVYPVRSPEAMPRTSYADIIEPLIQKIRDDILPLHAEDL